MSLLKAYWLLVPGANRSASLLPLRTGAQLDKQDGIADECKKPACAALLYLPAFLFQNKNIRSFFFEEKDKNSEYYEILKH